MSLTEYLLTVSDSYECYKGIPRERREQVFFAMPAFDFKAITVRGIMVMSCTS
jgi:hypothetical protein